MNAKIFISFASQDQKVATTLCSALESRGFQCWIACRDILPGENFQVAIVRAIREAQIMLLVFTANSNTSEEMNKELALASQNKLIVVPLRIEDVRPNDAFAYEFATRQWVDFFADWEQAMQQLAHRIESATRDAVAQASPILAPPVPEPQSAAEDPTPEPVVASPETAAPETALAEFAAAPLEAPVVGPRPGRRAALLIAASLLAVIALGLALVFPNVKRPEQHGSGARAMAVVVAPPAPQAESKPIADPPEPDAAAAAPAVTPVEAADSAPKKKKSRAAQRIDDVPF